MSMLTKTWHIIRQRMILQKHRKVASFWNQLIEKDQAGMLERFPLHAKMDFPTDKIIWQYWGQGITDGSIPDVVKVCFQSVEAYKGDYRIVRVDDNTFQQYLDLPDFIGAKRTAGIISRTFLSDILRLALLKLYGGVWLDATILLTDQLPIQFCEQDFFVFQRNRNEPYSDYWKNSYAYYWGWNNGYKVKMLNSIIFAKKQHALVSRMYHLLINYWKTEDKVIDYFFFQILYEQLMLSGQGYRVDQIVSDVNPHLLQTKLSGGDYPISYGEIFDRTCLHKLTYFSNDTVAYLRQILKENGGRY